jgi:hypothetical protein
MTPPRPIPIQPLLEYIPAELRERPQWVGWKYELDGSKWTKVPYDAETGLKASTTNRKTWRSFESAAEAYRQRRFDGIGYVFAKDDPFCGLDFDHCFDEIEDQKILKPEAARWVKAFTSYTEFSVSGVGLHVITKGRPTHNGKNNQAGFEVYDKTRYFTFTGDSYQATALPIAERQDTLDAFVAEYFPKTNGRPQHSYQSNGHAGGHFATWDALRAELGRRIAAHESGHRNGSGKIDCRGICHGGEGSSGLFYDPATNHARCNAGCEQAAILRAFGLPEKPEPPASKKSTPKSAATAPDGPIIRDVRMSDVKPMPVDWLWTNRIARSFITIIEGVEGVGKSTLLCAIAGAVTRGRGLPDMNIDEPGNVLWLSAEDDLSRVLQPRLEAAGADLSRVFAVGDPFIFDEKGILGLRERVAERQPALVIIDPIFAYVLGNPNEGAIARALTNQLKILADQFICSLVLVRHVGKTKGFGDPRAAGLYSIEWRAAARSVLLVGADPDNPQKRALTQTKNNLGPMAESIGYAIDSDSTSPSRARFSWTGASDLTAERILATMKDNADGEQTEKRNARSDAEEFLVDFLSVGARLVEDVKAEARKADISAATLRRAKDSLGVRSRGRGFGNDKKWFWVLPDEKLEESETVDAQGEE